MQPRAFGTEHQRLCYFYYWPYDNKSCYRMESHCKSAATQFNFSFTDCLHNEFQLSHSGRLLDQPSSPPLPLEQLDNVPMCMQFSLRGLHVVSVSNLNTPNIPLNLCIEGRGKEDW